MIERDGHFSWPEMNLGGGIRQNVTAAMRRWRLRRNFNWVNDGALTKDLGLRRLSQDQLQSGSYDLRGGIDAHYDDSTQKLFVFQAKSGGTEIYEFSNVGRTWGSAKATVLADVRPQAMMFNNKVCIFDGTTFTTINSSSTIAQPGTTGFNACRFGTVYGNRLIASGDSADANVFKPSAVVNETSANSGDIVEVTGIRGEAIQSLGRCGPYLIVGGREFTRAYYLGTGGPRDWDWDEISSISGPVNWESFVDVSLGRGNESQDVAFFWGSEGPMMILYTGRGLPILYSLWETLIHFCAGRAYEEMPALNLTQANNIHGAYSPQYREVRWGICKDTATTPDAYLCLDVDSAIAYAQNPDENYPWFRIRDNTGINFPASVLFNVEVDPDNGLPSTTGVVQSFTGRNGIIYEMDAKSVYKDNDQPMPIHAKRDGFDGIEDGVKTQVKSVNHVYGESNVAGKFKLFVNVIADEGNAAVLDEADLSGNLSFWTDDAAEGEWGDGGLWNAGEALPWRTEHGTLGRRHMIEVYDEGNINNDFMLQSLVLEGELEDRR